MTTFIKKNLISIFSKEKNIGVLTSAVAFFLTNGLNYYLHNHKNVDIKTSTFISIYIIGNFISYFLDFAFAKKNLYLSSYKGKTPYYGPVPFSDQKTRWMFIFKSFGKPYIFRFFILVLIEVMIGLVILKFILKVMDDNDILKRWKFRNVSVALLSSFFTFYLFIRTLRFDWVYEYKAEPIIDIIVSIWFTIIILIVVLLEDINISINNMQKNNLYYNNLEKN
jgi:hypothetical protein